jgi:hypothetical protein
VKGARLGLDGASEMTLTTDANGTAREAMVAVGAYRLVAQSVGGLMGTPAPLRVVIARGTTTRVAVSYDTGIR